MATSKKTKGQTLIHKKSLKVSQGLSESVNRKSTDNTMAERQKIQNDEQ